MMRTGLKRLVFSAVAAVFVSLGMAGVAAAAAPKTAAVASPPSPAVHTPVRPVGHTAPRPPSRAAQATVPAPTRLATGATTKTSAARRLPKPGSGGSGTYSVYFGYADSLRPNPVNFPTPWSGAAGVVFEGCTTSCGSFDDGAIEVINTSGSAETINTVSVVMSTCTINFWPSNVSVPAGQRAIFTAYNTGGSNGCPTGQTFDTSDVGPNGQGWAGNCAQSGVVPSVTLTVNSVASTYTDTGQVLNTGGFDAGACASVNAVPRPYIYNESEQWTPAGSPICSGSQLVTTPAAQNLAPGASATITATFTNSCHNPLSGASVNFDVTSGPDAGQTANGTTSKTGKTSFTFANNGTQGIDRVAVTIAGGGGTISANPTTVTFETATLSLNPTSGIPGANVSFTGTGYQAAETVNLYENAASGPQLDSVVADGSGNISGTFVVPNPTSSNGVINSVVAIGQTSAKQGWATFASSCTDVWTNLAGGDWNGATNWSTGAAPTASDFACIIEPGTYTVNLNTGDSVGALLIGDGTTTKGVQTLDVAAAGEGAFTFTTGPTSIVKGGVLALDSQNADTNTYITGGPITINGGKLQTLQGSGGGRYIRTNVTNTSTGSVAIQAAATYFDQSYTFVNNGSFTVSGSGSFMTNGNATFTGSGGTLANSGSMYFLSTYFTDSGMAETGNPVTVQNTTVTDSAGAGSYLFQCGNSLTGTIPAGQTVDVQSNGCGQANTQLSGTVTNKGTLTLESVDPTQNAYLTQSAGSLVNDGVVQTPNGSLATAYIRTNLTNDPTGTVAIGATTAFDQNFTFVNNGTFNVSAGGSFDTNGNAVFTGSGGTLTNNGTVYLLTTNVTASGLAETGNPVIVQNSTVTDSAGTGSYLFQCTNTLIGTIPVGQSIDVQANGCGQANTQLSGAVTNDGTLTVESIDATQSAFLTQVNTGSLTNEGTVQTIGGTTATRYIRTPLTNDTTGTLVVSGNTDFDQGYTLVNKGAFTVSAGDQFMTNGNATFTASAGTYTNNGSTYLLTTFFNLSGTAFSGQPPVVQNNSVTDSASTGTFVFQCNNTLSGTIPAGQTIDVQANGCGQANTQLSGTVVNDGTLSLSSVAPTQSAFLTQSSGSLTNDGTLSTTGGTTAVRYIRTNVTSNPGSTVSIAGATAFDQGYTFVTNGSFTVTSVGSFSTNGNATITESGGTMTDHGQVYVLSSSLNLNGTVESGNKVTVQNTTVTDSAGGGSYVLQCTNTLAGTIPAGQTIDVQTNGCGQANTQLSAPVTNNGTLSLDSLNADNSAFLTSINGGTLTNNGTFQTIGGSAGNRYIRVNVTNASGGTVKIQATHTFQDQSTTDTNNGTWSVAPGAALSLNSGSVFTQSSTGTYSVTINANTGTSSLIAGGQISVAGNAVVTAVGTPSVGSVWPVISGAASFSGTFASVTGTGHTYSASYPAGGASIQVLS